MERTIYIVAEVSEWHWADNSLLNPKKIEYNYAYIRTIKEGESVNGMDNGKRYGEWAQYIYFDYESAKKRVEEINLDLDKRGRFNYNPEYFENDTANVE